MNPTQRSRLVLLDPVDGQHTSRQWLAVGGEQDTSRMLHVIGEVDDVCRVVPVCAALDGAGAFDHVAVDASPGPGASSALEEFGVSLTTRRLDITGRSIARRLGALLEGFDGLLPAEAPMAVIIYSDDDASLACALSAARHRVPVVRVIAGVDDTGASPVDTNGILLNRLADLLLAPNQEHADRLVREHVPRHRIQVVGDPLMDMVRRYTRRSVALAVCRGHGVQPGGFAFVELTGRHVSATLAEPLSALAARFPLLVQIDPSAESAYERAGLTALLREREATFVEPGGFAARLCLERAAAAIVTDSRRTRDRAALLSVPCRLVSETRGAPASADGDAWDIAGLLRRHRGSNFGAKSLRDGGAPGRLADAIIANFARVAAVAS